MKVFTLTAAFAFVLFGGANLQAQTKGATKISAIRAQLFYEDKNVFSKDVLSDKDFSFWNAGAGEGSAEGMVRATLITVEVGGNDDSPMDWKLDVTLTGNKNRLIQKKTFDVFIYKEMFKFYAPVWLPDSTCEPIKITAKLVGKGAPTAPVVKTIPFACGE